VVCTTWHSISNALKERNDSSPGFFSGQRRYLNPFEASEGGKGGRYFLAAPTKALERIGI